MLMLVVGRPGSLLPFTLGWGKASQARTLSAYASAPG